MGTMLLAPRASDRPATDPRSPSPPDEVGLIDRARHDPAAFAPLYDHYFDPIYRYCHRRLGNPEDAADATSLVFARTLAALPRYQHRRDATFRSWVFAIAHNVITDGYRVRDRRAEAPIEVAGDLPDPSRDAAPEAVALAAETRRSLLAALALLSTDQRRIVELRLAGLTGPEIARVLNRTLGSVKVAQHRAYAKLRLILSPEAPETAHRSGGTG